MTVEVITASEDEVVLQIKIKLKGSLMEMEDSDPKRGYTQFIQAHRMKYDQYCAMNLPIGSGVTEAASKTLVKQRLYQIWYEMEGQRSSSCITVTILTNIKPGVKILHTY